MKGIKRRSRRNRLVNSNESRASTHGQILLVQLEADGAAAEHRSNLPALLFTSPVEGLFVGLCFFNSYTRRKNEIYEV